MQTNYTNRCTEEMEMMETMIFTEVRRAAMMNRVQREDLMGDKKYFKYLF